MAKKKEGIYRGAIELLCSSRFFYLALLLVAIQALWFIFSYQPWIFDEPKHLGRIYIYLDHINPILTAQDLAWDKYGEIIRNGSYMFYYLMSWPLKLFSLFTDDKTMQVILLRFVSLTFVITGIVFYRKALLEIGKIPRYLVNIVFLIMGLIPSFVLLAGAVNYDNLVFMLFAIELYIAIRVMKSRDINPKLLVIMLTIGLFSSVVKWTSMALFLPVILFVIVDQYKKYNLRFPLEFFEKFDKLNPVLLIILSIAFIVSAGLFIERPISNTIVYGKPEPPCAKVLTYERCMNYQDFAAYAKVDAQKPKDFQPLDPISYGVHHWGQIMLKTITNTLEKGRATALPVAKYLFASVSLVAIVLIVLYMREILRDKIKIFLLSIALLYTALLFIDEYMAYVRHGMPVAIRFRYLLPVLPIVLYFALMSLRHWSGRYRYYMAACFIAFLLLASQGGGFIANVLRTPEQYYWNNSNVREANLHFKNAVSQIILPQ